MTQTRLNNTSYDLSAVVVLTLLASITRSFGLGEWDFLVDEFATYYYADERMTGFRNPAYYALVHWSFQLLGENEFSARLPAMIFGVIAIPAFYWTWRHPLGRYAAFAGAIFILLSSWHLWYSQYSRFFSAVFLFGSLSFYFFWRAIIEDDLKKLAWALLANILGILFHFTAIMVPIACGVYLLLTLGFRCLRGENYSLRVSQISLVIYTAGGLVTLPFAFALLAGWQSSEQHWGYGPANFALQTIKYIQIPIAVSAALGTLVLLKNRKELGLLVALGIIVPGLALLGLSAVASVRPDYYFYSLPLVFAAAGYLCTTWLTNNGSGALASHALAMVLAAALLPEFVSHYTGHRSLDVRDTIRYIEQRLEPGDKVLALVSGFAHYSDGDMPLAYRPGSPYDGALDWQLLLEESRPAEGRLWIVAPAGRRSYSSRFQTWLGENAWLVWRKHERRYDYTFRSLEIYRTDRTDQAPRHFEDRDPDD